jgi:hypothetical protein
MVPEAAMAVAGVGRGACMAAIAMTMPAASGVGIDGCCRQEASRADQNRKKTSRNFHIAVLSM